MNTSDSNIAERRPGSRKTVTVTLSATSLAGSILILCTGFVLVFSLGILLGRGHNIESRIPELERLLPQPAATESPLIIADDENGAGAQAAPQQEASPRDQVIDQGDLAYREQLKTPSYAAQGRPSPSQKAPVQPAGTAPDAASQKNERQRTATPSPQQAPAGAAATQPSADTQVYRYVYQAAAYKDQPSCDKFTATLKAAGFQARTEKSQEKSSIWFKTMIDFTGKPDDTDALRANLKNHGVPRVILKSKTPLR